MTRQIKFQIAHNMKNCIDIDEQHSCNGGQNCSSDDSEEHCGLGSQAP